MGWSGSAFRAAHTSVLWIAGGASLGVLFSVAPYYLHFTGRSKTVLGVTAAAGGVNVTLLLLLAPTLGALGAAIAYGVSLGGMAVVLRGLALAALRR